MNKAKYKLLVITFGLAISAVALPDFKLCNQSNDALDFKIKKNGNVLCSDWSSIPAPTQNQKKTGNCKIARLTEKDCTGNSSPTEVMVEVDSHSHGKCNFDAIKNSISVTGVVEMESGYIICKTIK